MVVSGSTKRGDQAAAPSGGTKISVPFCVPKTAHPTWEAAGVGGRSGLWCVGAAAPQAPALASEGAAAPQHEGAKRGALWVEASPK